MKTPYDFLARMMPKPTPADEAEARSLGVSIDEYRAMKLQVQHEQAKKQAGGSGLPDDIAAEEEEAHRMRREPGIIKRRNETPNLLVQAAKTPGEVAKMILFVICYVIGLAAIVVFGGERVQKMPGIFQCVALGILILPCMWVTDRVWEAIGERARDGIRALVRFWPLTLIAFFFALVMLVYLKRQLLQ